MADAAWWYEWEGRQAGPVAETALVDLLRTGKLAPGARVWRAGMAGWEPARSVAELAAAVPSPPAWTSTAPPSGRDPAPVRDERGQGSTSPSSPSTGAGTLPPGMEPASLGAILGLGLLTLGIYPAVKFYQAAGAYQALAERPSRFAAWFWLALALSLAGGPAYLLGGLAGAVAHAAGLAFAILALFEALALRADAARRWGVAPAMTSDATHKALFVVGLVTSWLLVGLVLLVVQMVKFFDDHRALGDALRARAEAPRAA